MGMSIQKGDKVKTRMKNSMFVLVWFAAALLLMGLVSPVQAATVLWYGKSCKDENGAPLKNGSLVQLIRSPDAVIGAPDATSGAPTGGDAVCATASYIATGTPSDYFQGEEWIESSGYYICVRIWNAGNAASGTYYWDSAVHSGSGMLPVDIECTGAQTSKRK